MSIAGHASLAAIRALGLRRPEATLLLDIRTPLVAPGSRCRPQKWLFLDIFTS